MRKVWPFYLLVMFLLLLSWSQGSARENLEDQPTVEKIFAKTEEIYSSCRTYQDEGFVKTAFYSKDGKRTVVRPFKTSFVRPGQFRFEFQERRGEEEWDKYIVWRDAESVKSFWTVEKKVKSGQSLFQALYAAKGISGTASYDIPRLLIPHELQGEKLTGIANAKLIGVESMEGDFLCYKVRGLNFRKEPVTLWIDKESFLIRQIQESKNFEDFKTEEVTSYKPQINGNIGKSDLQFSQSSLERVEQ